MALGSAANVAYPSLLAFLQDRPTQAIVVRNAPTLGYRTTEGAWYLQDDIKLRSNFNLRLGLRHEMTNGWNEVAGRCSNYFYDANFVIETNPRIGRFLSFRSKRTLCYRPRAAQGYPHHALFISPPVSIRTCSRPRSRCGTLRWNVSLPEI